MHFLIGPNFIDKLESIENGNAWILVDVPEEYKDETDIFKLVDVSSKTSAYVFTREDKVIVDTAVRLKAPVAVTFKMPELLAGFPGNLHKFKDKQYMCKVMSDDYIGFERTLDSIEPGVYYICLVLLQDYRGKLNYDYFVNNLRYEKLTAYYLEKGQELTFKYKNNHYDS